MRDAAGLLAFVCVGLFFGLIGAQSAVKYTASECLKHEQFTADGVTFLCVKVPAAHAGERKEPAA